MMKTPEEIIREAEALRKKQNMLVEKKPTSAYGAAMRIAIELAAALVVSGAVGWFIDDWLGTLPLFMILCICIGIAAGMRTIKRVNDALNKEWQQQDNIEIDDETKKSE